MLSRFASLAGLLILSPVYLAVGIVVLLQLGPPVLFFQKRVGRNYRFFRIWKFRTMQDERANPVMQWLRQSRLDELPQLVNILRGDMAFIGPRPEIPKFVERNRLWSKVLSVKPGLFDAASLQFLDEARLLSAAADSDQAYRTFVLPEKLALSASYIERRTASTDFALLIQTLALLLKGIVVAA